MNEETPTPKARGRVGQFFATGLFYLICLVFLLPLILIALFFEKLGEFSEALSEILSDFATTARKNIAVPLKAKLWDEAVEIGNENNQLKTVNRVLREENEDLARKLAKGVKAEELD